MSRGKRIVMLMQELQRMPEYELIASLRGFNISIYTFDKNYSALRKLIEFLANDPKAEPLFWVRNRDKLQNVMREIIRLLHNHVASALSLLDHTRRLHRKLYSEGEKFNDYQVRIDKEFARDPLAQFVKGLRKYCQHYKSPDLAITTSWQKGDESATRTVGLFKEDLLTFDGWSAAAKKYLEAVEEKVDVLEVATAYRDKLLGFYEWFRSRQLDIHSEELKAFRDKETELLILTLEDRLESAFRHRNHEIPHERDEIFLSIFSSSEFAELEKIPIESIERPRRAIQLLEQGFPVPDHVKQQIYRWYKEVGSKL